MSLPIFEDDYNYTKSHVIRNYEKLNSVISHISNINSVANFLQHSIIYAEFDFSDDFVSNYKIMTPDELQEKLLIINNKESEIILSAVEFYKKIFDIIKDDEELNFQKYAIENNINLKYASNLSFRLSVIKKYLEHEIILKINYENLIRGKPKIEFNDTEFYLLQTGFLKNNDVVDKRKGYKLISVDKITKYPFIFYCYGSNSEGGTLRLLYLSLPYRLHLYKGADYITITFIAIELQQFIFQNITNPNVVNDNIDMEFLSTIKDAFYASKRILSLLDCENNYEESEGCLVRLVKDNELDAIKKICDSAKCFNTNIKKEDKSIFLTHPMMKKNPKSVYEHLEISTDSDRELLQKISEIEYIPPVQKYTKEETKTIKYNIKSHIHNTITKISEFLRNNFFIINHEEINFKRPDISLLGDGTLLPLLQYLNSYRYTIKNKKNNYEYYVYYSIYKIQYKKKILNNSNEYIFEDREKTYKIIDQLVPKKTNLKILPYGVYSHVVSAGIMNYKMYDYVKQTHGRFIDGTVFESSGYYFIGQYLTNLWPLNEKRIIIKSNISGKINIINKL